MKPLKKISGNAIVKEIEGVKFQKPPVWCFDVCEQTCNDPDDYLYDWEKIMNVIHEW